MSITINFGQYFGQYIRAKKDVSVMRGPSYKLYSNPNRIVKAGDIIFKVKGYTSISTWQEEYDGDGKLPRNWLLSDKYEYVFFDETSFEISNDVSTTEVTFQNAKRVFPGHAIDYEPYNANYKIIKEIPWKEVGGGPFAIEMPKTGDIISGKRMRVFSDNGDKEEILLWHAVLYGIDTGYCPMIPLTYLEATKDFPTQGKLASEDDYSGVGSILRVYAMAEDTVKIIGEEVTTVRTGDTVIERITKEPLKTSEVKSTATAVTGEIVEEPLIVSNFTENKTDIPFIIKVIGIGIIIWLLLK